MNFFRHTLFGSLIIGALYLAAFFYFLSGNREAPLTKSVEWENLESMKQERLFMTKHFLYNSPDGNRLQFCARSKESLLMVEKREGKHALVEKMKGLKGLFQEKLYFQESNPMQLVHYFEADQAEYESKKGVVSAGSVKIVKMNLPGHQFGENFKQKKVLMEGKCDQATLFLFDKNFHFKAHGFKAVIHGETV